MIKIFILTSLFSIYLHAQQAPFVDDQYGRVVDSCKKVKSDKNVWIFKQWHLLPSDNTKEFPDKSYPQKENLKAIYEQLNLWVELGKVQAVFAEGCAGEIDSQFELKFNGWTMSDLAAEATKDTYSKIPGHVPMMIEAKHGDKVRTVCGDNQEMIVDQNLKFSDLRGAIGFLTRLEKFEGKTQKEKPYLEAIAKAYGIKKKKITGDYARSFLKAEVKKLISQIEKGIEKRNKSFVDAIVNTFAPQSVVVIGGVHAKNLKSLLEKKKLNCQVVEFKGYDYDEEEMIRKIKNYFQ